MREQISCICKENMYVNRKIPLCVNIFFPSTSVGCHFVNFVFSLFVMLNCNYYPDKCGVLNKIIEPAIFIFKINTN